MHLVTFFDRRGRWQAAARRLVRAAIATGKFSTITALHDGDLATTFPTQMARVIDLSTLAPQGFGAWAWKPLVAKYALSTHSEGDIVFYVDAGCSINFESEAARSRFDGYLEMVERDSFLFFQQTLLERDYTDPAVLEEFGHNPEVSETGQLLGGIWALKVSSVTKDFAEEWWRLASKNDFRLLRGESKVAQHRHRHDQSILSCLAKTKRLPSIPDETYFSPDWELFGRKFPIWATRLRLPFQHGYRGSIFWRLVRLVDRLVH